MWEQQEKEAHASYAIKHDNSLNNLLSLLQDHKILFCLSQFYLENSCLSQLNLNTQFTIL